MAGRPRKLTKILELTGAFKKNPARGRERANEPQPDGPLPGAPDYFQPDQVARWNAIARAGELWLTGADEGNVELAAKLWAQERRGELNAEDRRLWMATMRDLGLTPASRSKVQVARGSGKKKKTEFGEFRA